MKITHITHSCFLVEMERNIFLFDWYKGEIPPFDSNKKIYVLSSHKHQDHFNMEIFKKMEAYPNVSYILSKDIRLSPNYLKRNDVNLSVRSQITFVGKNQVYKFGSFDNRLEVQTLTSTDAGVAFVITCEDKVIYHAGDLNWWTWQGEELEEEKKMEQDYIREINKLKGIHFDVAFVVLDPRQEERYWWGLDYFMRVVCPEKVVPMHCWGKYSIIDKLKQENCAKDYVNKIISIDREGQMLNL